MSDKLTRSLVIPLTVETEQYRAVVASLRRVRAAARQCYAVLFAAQAAGAEITLDGEGNARVTPSNERAKTILEAAMNKAGKAACYEMRDYVLTHLCPTIRSFVWDDLRRRVWTRWRARDPEFPRAGMGWLALQNVRGLAAFRFTPIGFPAAVLRRNWAQDHGVRLEWDREIGRVMFSIGTLDPGRWRRWQQIVSGEVPHGTVLLNERDGRLSLTVSYQIASTPMDLDADRQIRIHLTEDGSALSLVGPDGERTYDRIELCEAVAWLTRLGKQQRAWEARRGACGSPCKPWGEPRRFRAVVRHQNRLTRCRENGMHGRNHAWAKRIATRAGDWRCGRVLLELADDATLSGHSWGWANLADKIRYRLQAIGAELHEVALTTE